MDVLVESSKKVKDDSSQKPVLQHISDSWKKTFVQWNLYL